MLPKDGNQSQLNIIICEVLTTMSVAFSIPQAKRQDKLLENPGPGQYNPETSPKITKRMDPQYSIGRQKREGNLKSEVPGPGTYNSHEIKAHVQVKPKEQFQKQPSYSFRIKTKDHTEQNPIGPGAYMAKEETIKEKSPAYSMRPRAKSSLGENVPGPGNYNPFKSSVVYDHGPKFGHEKKDFDINNPVPGPGSYDYENAFNRYLVKNDPAYGIGSRLASLKTMDVPGPGAYQSGNPKSEFSKIGGIMSRDMRLSSEKMSVPGPGAYSGKEDFVKSKMPSFSLPKQRRDSSVDNFVPGPGQYESPQSYRKVAEHSPDWKFTQEKRIKQLSNEVPGPGNYNPQDYPGRKGSYIGIKTKDHEGLNVPGPGAYDSSLQYKGNKSQMYSVGKSPRDSRLDNYVPGPGAYNGSDIPSRRNIRFAIDKRVKDQKNYVPGPGHYEIKPMFADLPKYALPNKS